MVHKTYRRPATHKRTTTTATVAFAAVIALPFLTCAPAAAAPMPIDNFAHVPPRTAIAYHNSLSDTHVGTANEHESRPGLSMVKLYITDFALRQGDGSEEDIILGERMIRLSDNAAADRAFSKYPNAIDDVAREYGLPDTRGAAHWGQAFTSAADLVRFLAAKRSNDPESRILAWMGHPGSEMADGTPQNYGTSHLPGCVGSKWGMSSFGQRIVASASFGTDFTVATITYGGPTEQTDDVLSAFRGYPTRPPELSFTDALVWEVNTFMQVISGG